MTAAKHAALFLFMLGLAAVASARETPAHRRLLWIMGNEGNTLYGNDMGLWHDNQFVLSKGAASISAPRRLLRGGAVDGSIHDGLYGHGIHRWHGSRYLLNKAAPATGSKQASAVTAEDDWESPLA